MALVKYIMIYKKIRFMVIAYLRAKLVNYNNQEDCKTVKGGVTVLLHLTSWVYKQKRQHSIIKYP